MANNHHAHITTRNDYTGSWKLNIFKDARVKSVVMKCETCAIASRREPLTRQQFKKLVR